MKTKKQLTNINKFKRTDLPILTNILIEPRKATVVGGWGGKFQSPIFYIVSHNIPTNGTCLVSIEEFVKIARKYDITEMVVRDNKAEFRTAAGDFSLISDDQSEFPVIPVLKHNTGYEITKETIDRYSPYMSSDDLRPATMGIHFDDGIASTDGHRLRFDNKNGIGEDQSFILSSEAVDLVTQDTYNHAIFDTEHETFHALVSEDETIIYTRVNEQYPNWRSIVPAADTQTYTFNSEDAKKFIEAALITANQQTKQVILKPEHNHVKITAYDLDLNKEYNSPYFGNVSNVVTDEFEAGFNGGYFLEMLKNNPGNVTMKMDSANRAAVINGSELLMPMMLNI